MTNIEKNHKYFNFPLCFLQAIDHEKKALNKICGWAIVNYSKTIKYEIAEVARQTVYSYYRRWSDLTYKLKDKFHDMMKDGRIETDEDYNGFAGDTFVPESGEIEAILKEFKEDPEFKKSCIEFYQHLQVKKILNITGGSIENNYNDFETLNSFLHEFEASNGRDAWTSVKTSYLFDARDGQLPIDLFRLVCAVKSIIGKRNFNKTYKNVVLSRMFGAKKPDLMQPDDKEKYDKLSRRRQWNNLIDKAEQRTLLTFIPASRGYFVSIKYNSEKLRDEVIKRTKISRRKMKIIQYPKKIKTNEISKN